jgi:hypothetical protein
MYCNSYYVYLYILTDSMSEKMYTEGKINIIIIIIIITLISGRVVVLLAFTTTCFGPLYGHHQVCTGA